MHCNGVLDDVEFSTETSEILLQPFCSGCGLKQQSRGGRQRGDAGETSRRAAPGLCASKHSALQAASTLHLNLNSFPNQRLRYWGPDFQLTLGFMLFKAFTLCVALDTD